MNIKEILDENIAKINTKEFIKDDPVQFPHRFSKLQDIEIATFTTATISWGRRDMILRNAHKMLALMNNSPYNFVMNGDYEGFGTANIHRTFFQPDLAYMLRGFKAIYSKYQSIEEFIIDKEIDKSDTPAWELCREIQQIAMIANGDMVNSRCYAQNIAKSPIKRINMALRWLVRNDGVVDLGVWRAIKPSQLYIPLDVHVGNTARELGMITRKANDRVTVNEITNQLREFNPIDPIIYDFALFGIGVNKKR